MGSYRICFVALFTVAFVVNAGASPQRNKVNIPIRTSVSTAEAPLTTRTVIEKAQSARNPHRRRWVFERNLEFIDLRSVPKQNSRYVIQTSGIVSQGTIHLRQFGEWYLDLKKFPCSDSPADWFDTLKGTRAEAQRAARLWEAALRSGGPLLARQLQSIESQSSVDALKTANLVFRVFCMRNNI